MLKLRLDKFKKVGQDETSSTLVSPKGEKIKIAHSLLPASMKDQIAKMPMSLADGGEVNNDTVGAPDDPSVKGDSSRSPNVINVFNSPPPSQPQPLDDQGQHFITNADKIKQGIKGIASQMPGLWNPQAAQDYASNVVAENTPPPPMTPDQPASQSQSPQLTPNQPQTASPQSQPYQAPYGLNDYNKALNQGISGVQNEAVQQGKLGSAVAGADTNYQNKLVDIEKKYTDLTDNLTGKYNTEIDSIQKDVADGHIGQNHYLENMGTGQKIATVIGLILGGMGAGLTHDENPALRFLNAQIDRDMQAQRMRMDTSNTILGAIRHQIGDVKDAEKLAYANQYNLYATEVEKQKALFQGPVAQEKANQLISDLKLRKMDLINQVATKQAALGTLHGLGSNASPESIIATRKMGGLDSPKETDDLNNDLDKAKTLTKNRDAILDAFDMAAEANTPSNRSLHPLDAVAAIDTAKKHIGTLAHESFGRLTKEDTAFITDGFKGITDDPKRVAIKRQDMARFASKTINFSRLKEKGIDPDRLGVYDQHGKKIFDTSKVNQ